MQAQYTFGEHGCYREDKRIVCQEKGMKFILNNPQQKKVLQVRPEQLGLAGKQCDYLLIPVEVNHAMFIELKKTGDNIAKALEQLQHSIKVINDPQNGFVTKAFAKKSAFAILKSWPKANTNKQRYKEAFRKQNIMLHIKTVQHEETLV